jgi:hypothetical protein
MLLIYACLIRRTVYVRNKTDKTLFVRQNGGKPMKLTRTTQILMALALVVLSLGCGDRKMRARVAALDDESLAELVDDYEPGSKAGVLIREELARRGIDPNTQREAKTQTSQKSRKPAPLSEDGRTTPPKAQPRSRPNVKQARPEQSRLSVPAKSQSTSALWTDDWPSFVNRLATEVAKENYFVGNVNDAFLDKVVRWEGTISEIKRPSGDDSGLVRLDMEPQELKMKSGTPTLDSILLTPKPSEWGTWEGVSVGDKVKFTTTLTTSSWAVPKCVLSYMQGMGPNAGKTRAWINTGGGKNLGRQSK